MQIKASDVKKLRELTGAGMMDCKKALQETNGDMEKAIDLLREKGAAKAVKKSGKVAAEGVIKLRVSDDNKKAVLVEINTQTDFVAKNEGFVELSDKIVDHIFDNNIDSIESLNESTIDDIKFTEFLSNNIANIGENIVVRRIELYQAKEDEYVLGYVHFNNSNGVVLKVKTDSEKTFESAKDLLRNVTMHISAMEPEFISYKELDQEFLEKELAALKGSLEVYNEEAKILNKPLKHIPKYGSRAQITDEVLEEEKMAIREELLAEGKPEKILDKIIPGKLAKFLEDNTQIDAQYALYSQAFVLDADKTVEEALEEKAKELNGNIEVVAYKRYKVGDGIEKKEENFAEEVASQMRGE
ncbi:MAG: translation elongation factor Ts [Tissierellia bacterium]|nr:translation elongation factor Ts [Tissierellia bacterium]